MMALMHPKPGAFFTAAAKTESTVADLPKEDAFIKCHCSFFYFRLCV